MYRLDDYDDADPLFNGDDDSDYDDCRPQQTGPTTLAPDQRQRHQQRRELIFSLVTDVAALWTALQDDVVVRVQDGQEGAAQYETAMSDGLLLVIRHLWNELQKVPRDA